MDEDTVTPLNIGETEHSHDAKAATLCRAVAPYVMLFDPGVVQTCAAHCLVQ